LAGSIEGDAQPGILRSREAAAPIGAALAGSISNLHKEPAAALGEIADPDSLALLRRYEDDPDPDVRKTVRWTIGRIR
jgi:HEAT repeat protein